MVDESSRVRLLVLEEDDGDYATLGRRLRACAGRAPALSRARSDTQALQRLRSAAFDLVCVSDGAGEAGRMQLVQEVAARYPDLPIVLLRRPCLDPFALGVFGLDVSDCLTKWRFDADELARGIRYALAGVRVGPAAAEAQRRRRLWFESNADAAVMVDRRTGAILAVNNALSMQCGMAAEQLEKRGIGVLIAPVGYGGVPECRVVIELLEQAQGSGLWRVAHAAVGGFDARLTCFNRSDAARQTLIVCVRPVSGTPERCAPAYIRSVAAALPAVERGGPAATGGQVPAVCRDGRDGAESLVLVCRLAGVDAIRRADGDAAAAQVLAEIRRRLRANLRGCDMVSSVGDDALVALLPHVGVNEDPLATVERLVAVVAEPCVIAPQPCGVTASIGVAAGDACSAEVARLIEQATLAMRQAEAAGGNAYRCYPTKDNRRIFEQLSFRNELGKAIDAGEFQLYYQPQVDSRCLQVVGVEALLRWPHPRRGMLLPADFMSVAEQTGRIAALNQWVIATACRQIKSLQAQGIDCGTVAVNITSLQPPPAGFAHALERILEETGMAADGLELELTEAVLFDDAQRTQTVLGELDELGVRLSIDDFGTGLSNLGFLRQLPITRVKIDRGFIRAVISDHRDAAITRGIIAMAHHFDLTVVAEGVEDEAQVAFLKRSRCDVLQGYYFGRPMPIDALRDTMRAGARPISAPDTGVGDSAPTLLLLDDEPNIVRALVRLMRRDGYRVLTAHRAQEAFELLAKHTVHVIISDQRMPEMSGTDFFSRVKQLYPDTVRIVLSGYTDLNSVTEAVNEGAIYKFLTKPWIDDELRQTVRLAFQHHVESHNRSACAAPAADSAPA